MQEQYNSFAENGFLVLKYFLSAEEITIIQKEVNTVISVGRDWTCAREHNTLLPLRWNDRVVELFLESERRITELKEAAEANDLKWISGYISIKEPHSPPLWWHQDWWCWQHDISFKKDTTQMALLCYLTNTNEYNGALKVLPGSHRQKTKLHSLLPEAHTDKANKIKQQHAAMNNQKGQITLRMNAGDAVIIDYRLLHATHSNESALRRDCVLLSFTPSWKLLPDDIKGHLINHLALPNKNEIPFKANYESDLLPTFNGARNDLEVNRVPPREFEMT